MRPRIRCPDPARLRLFLCEPSPTLDTDGVRSHLAQCESCRALIAALATGNELETTLPLEGEGPVVATRGALNGHCSARTHAEGMNGAVPGVAAKPNATIAEDGPTLPTMASTPGAAPYDAETAAATCAFDLNGDSKPPSRFGSITLPSTQGDGPDPPLTPKKGVLDGVTVPGYDILAELGRGGMGVVYKARDQRLHRLVALKMVLSGAHAGEVGLARFRAEAEAVAKLTHANIVQIYETGEYEGRPFFSLEFVEGGSLDHRLGEGPTSPKAAARFVETLARAMEVAHQAGIIHRDLKPANILLAKLGSQSSLVRVRDHDSTVLGGDHWSRNTVPKIADFGLAKRTDDASNQTQTGAILGTPSYMAPEQAGGKTHEIGPAVDIYALGAILYELLVGRPPFKAGNPLDTVRQVVEQEPVPPRQLEPRVPLDLETICLKCLEKDPARRFASAAALADDLHRFVEGAPIHSRPTPAWERVWKWGKRRPAIVALLAVCVAAALGMVLFIVWHNVSLRGQLDVALADERQARLRERNAVAEQHLTLLRQEGQKLFDGARVAAAARDWADARLLLEKMLTTIGSEARLADLKDPAQALLLQAEDELRIEADRRATLARVDQFGRLRDEAQFLGTLYTGMDLASNLVAARASAQAALAVYGISAGAAARPTFDNHLSVERQAGITGDCAQLLLVLAETEARSSAEAPSAEREAQLRRALAALDQAARLGAPVRAVQMRRARYLGLLGDKAGAAQAETAARQAPLEHVLDHFLMADELYRRERFDEAIKEFDQVLERQPGHFWAQYLNALCLLRQGRPAEARALLSACLAQRSDFVWLYLLRGYAQGELQAWGAAEADFEKALGFPLDEHARYVLLVDRGVLRVRQGRFTDAIADLEVAIALKPRAYQAYVDLALAYRGLHQLDQALEALNHAIESEPGLALLSRLRARLRLERNEPDLALADFDQALAQEKSDSPFRVDDHVERGRLLLRRGRHADALRAFDAALALQRDHARAQRLRGEVLFLLGRFEDVIDAFNRYLENGKPLESVYRGRGLAQAELGKYAAAIDDFTEALELQPSSSVFAYRGWTHLVVDASKLALRDFELAIELDPKNADAYNGRGFARVRLGQTREGVADAAEGLRLGPESPRLLYNAARVYAQSTGPDPQRALDLIQQALRLLPADKRRAFWSTHIRKDAAMLPLRRRPLFLEIEAALARGH